MPRKQTKPSNELTIGEYVQFLSPRWWEESDDGKRLPNWPPDAFAIAASLLSRSGAYRNVVEQWPPDLTSKEEAAKIFGQAEWEWLNANVDSVLETEVPMLLQELSSQHGKLAVWRLIMAMLGDIWIEGWNDFEQSKVNTAVPKPVKNWWAQVVGAFNKPLVDLRTPALWECCNALLQIVAATDEASENLGLPQHTSSDDEPAKLTALRYALEQIGKLGNGNGNSLCSELFSASRVRVLPKVRTTQTGITMRSLTFNLALCPTSEIVTRWFMGPSSPDPNQIRHRILIVPHPLVYEMKNFQPCEPEGIEADYQNGFFSYSRVPDPDARLRELSGILEVAKAECGGVEAIVYPELSLHHSEFEQLTHHFKGGTGAVGKTPISYLLAGIFSGSESNTQFAENYLKMHVPQGGVSESHAIIQHKHHRWCLDRSQIEQYGLASQLSPNLRWWEAISLKDRSLAFIALHPWLTMCTLICEDLARPDPIGEIVRSVGPNLVIALLMDGPQLTNRWSSRYASVLADDPGSSVLTVTSLGMVLRSRDRQRLPADRTIALWRDKISGAVPIELPIGADAVVLTLTRYLPYREVTADGREQNRDAPLLVLSDVQPIQRKT